MQWRNKLSPLSAIIFLIGYIPIMALGQGTARQNSAQERAADLRTQLSEVEARQTDLQTRLQQIDENLKPENIANSLAGVGATRPEEVREERRRQLEIEKTGVKAQLEQLAVSHSRLGTEMAQADAEAYRQSAGVSTARPSQSASPQDPVIQPSAHRLRRTRRSRTKRTKRVVKVHVLNLYPRD